MVLVIEQDDGALVQRSIHGDRAAFEQLVIRYQKPVYNAALKLLHDPEEARDVAQTTFLNVFEHLSDYDPGFKFYSWITGLRLMKHSMPSAGASHTRKSAAKSPTMRRGPTARLRVYRPATPSRAL